MKFGTVRCYDCDSGLGIISPSDGGRDVIVRQAAIDRAGLGQLAAGQKIGFNISPESFGIAATDLWATWSNR